MELTSEKSCCSAGNNQVDEQATLYLSLPLFRLVSGNVFTKTGWGPWLRGVLGPAGVINFTPLSALSF